MSVGDVVKHRTGDGPPMTVSAVDERGRVVCKWFAEFELCTGWFRSEELEIVKAYK